MKNKLIINCYNIKPKEALLYVTSVIGDGKISEARGIKHYCWHTVFNRGTKEETSVSVNQKKTEKSADSFNVYR